MAKVSIIMPLYKSGNYCFEAIESVLNQSYQDWELILVDDASGDSTLHIIKEKYNDKRILTYELEKNSGPAVARNHALSKAHGRYIAFLDSDDLWRPKKLEKQLKFMISNDIEFSYTAYEKINYKGEHMGFVGVPDSVNYNVLLKTCVIGCLTAIYDSAKLGKVNMPEISKRQDFALWLKLLKKTKFAYGIPEPLAIYRVHSDGISFNKRKAAIYTWKVYREVEGFSVLKSTYYFFHYAIRGLIRAKWPTLARKLGVMHK
ncbi:glycosyltransferase family 2 protein [Modicisalibacter xianhensis]|uniref:Glycosyltransferase involved in cell wall bisynthesis n=1 Tax=Modicisalibacter xianhensis TaxID=442341 RepID=A0A1I3C723_9GAMM|nr:glycosyltransferase family 2 protein [Halomonas xianhensis]SFH70364.1 Glycosyltransferase involved in cell wall bisynthesis [Halomonas xianhensis]